MALDPKNIPFYEMARVCRILKLISGTMEQKIVDVYRFRHSVHVHHERRKSTTFALTSSGQAFKILSAFRGQVVSGLLSPKYKSFVATGHSPL